MRQKSYFGRAAAAVLLLLPAAIEAGPRYDQQGQLLFPADYREWIWLSSGVGMTYGPAAQTVSNRPPFDNVFVEPAAYRAFRNTGRWPDQTVFVLEIRRSVTHGSINRGGYFQDDVVVIEAAVKDEKRFPEKWAYFTFSGPPGQPRAAAAPQPKTASCLACHSANGAVENTFVQFYPTLLPVAREKGTLRASFKPFSPSPTHLYDTFAAKGPAEAERLIAAARESDTGAAIAEEATLLNIGYALLRAGETNRAGKWFGMIARQFPHSAGARSALAEARKAGAGR